MTPEYYAGVWAASLFFQGGAVPERTEAAAVAPLPKEFVAEMDSLGIVDNP
jgi:hypothetical protein